MKHGSSGDYGSYMKYKGSPGSDKTSSKTGPRDSTSKPKLGTGGMVGIGDSRPSNDDRRQSAK